nr:reverse transcriptase domain-containing protein [Tanacetum cinerariifolium]
MNQTERQEEKVAENASNKTKWEGNHNRSLSQQNKGHKGSRAHTAWPINKKAYVGSLPLSNQCKFHHSGPCTTKCGNYKKVGHIIQNFRTPATAKNQRTRTYYKCGSLRHYKSECLIVKFHKHVDVIHGRMRASKPKTMQDAIGIATKLRNKKISTLVECQNENKKRLGNTSKNNQNQQQPNKRQNSGRDYTARHGEKKHYGKYKPLCSKCDYPHDGPCGTFMKRRPKECYDLIENMTAHHNDWDTSAQRNESSSSITSFSNPEIVALKAEMAEINKNLIKVLQINQQVKAVILSCETCGGPHSYNDCPATVGQTHNVYVSRAYQSGNSYQPQGNNQGKNQFFQGASYGPNPPPTYQAPAYQASGYQAPVHQPPIPQPQVVTTTEFTNYMKVNDAILKICKPT